jgi:hypothetical protein
MTALLTAALLSGSVLGDAPRPDTAVFTDTLRMTGRGPAPSGPPARPFPPLRPAGGVQIRVPTLRMTGRGQG